MLFQLPPNMKKDLERLKVFLEFLPHTEVHVRVPAFDLVRRRPVFEALKASDIPLCIWDQDGVATPLVATATWGYVRLHKLDYDEPSLATWAPKRSPVSAGPIRSSTSSTTTRRGPGPRWP